MDVDQKNKSEEHEQKSQIKPGETFTGKNKEGESKEDPEKALKDSRGGAGLNALEVKKDDVRDVPHVSDFLILMIDVMF